MLAKIQLTNILQEVVFNDSLLDASTPNSSMYVVVALQSQNQFIVELEIAMAICLALCV